MTILSAARELETLAGEQSVPSIEFSGFPWWHALQVTPNREVRSAEMLKRVHVHAYLPRFVAHVRAPRGRRRAVLRAVIPGMLFVPIEMIVMDGRDDLFDLCHVHDFVRKDGGDPIKLRKADIEIIREMEAKLYVPPPPEPSDLWAGGVGDHVRFRNDLYRAMLGDGVVKDVDQRPRIGVEVTQLFGSPRIIWTTAAEIEAM